MRLVLNGSMIESLQPLPPFHRFQMFVWTLVLGVVFVVRVAKDLAMPGFDTVLLGLVGISNGTYLGMIDP